MPRLYFSSLFKDGDGFLITILMHLEVEHRGHEDREELLLFVR